jgi:hypothetical protein
MARGCAHPSGVIQRTVGATLYLDGGGAGAGAVSSRVHAPAPRWDSAPLAKIHNPAAATHRPGRVQQCRHAAELYDGLDAAAEPRCADLHLQTVRPLRPHERASRGRRPLCQQMRAASGRDLALRRAPGELKPHRELGSARALDPASRDPLAAVAVAALAGRVARVAWPQARFPVGAGIGALRDAQTRP